MSKIYNFKGKRNGFENNPQNINKSGRPKKIYTLLKEMGYSRDDIMTAYGELLSYTIQDLKKLIDDENMISIVRIVSKTIVESFEDGSYSRIKDVVEMYVGRPNQKIEHQGNMISETVKITYADD